MLLEAKRDKLKLQRRVNVLSCEQATLTERQNSSLDEHNANRVGMQIQQFKHTIAEGKRTELQ